MWISGFPSIICWIGFFSSVCLCYFAKDQMALVVWVYFLVFYSVPLIFLCFCASTMMFLLLGLCSISSVLWYLQYCSFCSGFLFYILGLLFSHIYFRIFFSIYEKNAIGMLIGIALNL
jgi:hypothetical protein